MRFCVSRAGPRIVNSGQRHPRDVLQGAQAGAVALPVCDHYSGVESRMKKSLSLQADMAQEFGACVFDVTLDCEDGAPVGGEADHAALVAELALGAAKGMRVAARVHPVEHPSFASDVATIVGRAGHRLSHLMIPKVESVADVVAAVEAVDLAGGKRLALQALIESPLAVHNAFEIAAEARIESLSFGLMDFVSAHAGAIPAEGMAADGQFSHPLVVRAKLAIASAAHAHGKVPSHCVVTEFNDSNAIRAAARRAASEFGYTRMWSIHPNQIRPIIEAFAPDDSQILQAADILIAGVAADWAPVDFAGTLHDRASYRHFWQVLVRAHATGRAMPTEAGRWFDDAVSS